MGMGHWVAPMLARTIKTHYTMAIKVTKRHVGERECTYSISGLTFAQAFRIKNAMVDCEKKMKEISDEWKEAGNLAMAKDFRDYAGDARAIFNALSGAI